MRGKLEGTEKMEGVHVIRFASVFRLRRDTTQLVLM